MNIIEKPPFNVEINGTLYTSDSSALKHRLPSNILKNIVENIYRKAEEVDTTVYLEKVDGNMYELFIEDDDLCDNYCVYLYKVGNSFDNED